MSHTHWNPDIFERFQAGRDQVLIAEDEARLKETFNYAAFSRQNSTAMLALEWARENGVNFYIDHKRKDCSGYYMPGTGCVGLVETSLGYELGDINTIVHEVRHAWQDQQGLITNIVRDFSEGFIRLSLLEADAYAHGQLAAYGAISNTTDYLQRKFKNWYQEYSAISYGNTFSWQCAKELGLDTTAPQLDLGDTIQYEHFVGKGIDISHKQDITKLGKSFNHSPYIADKAMWDFVTKVSLSPTLAMAFYKQERSIRPYEEKIRKTFLKMKRQNSDFCI